MRTIEEVVKEIEERLQRRSRERFAVTPRDEGFNAALRIILAFINTDPPCLHRYFIDAEVLMPGTYSYCPECGQNMKENHADNREL